MLKFVVLLACFALNYAFLLDNTPSKGQTLGSNQYLTVDDKVIINHALDEIRRDHERSLNILTSQLQQKFADLEKTLSQNKTNSELLKKIANLQNDNQELHTNFTELHTRFQVLQNNYDLLKSSTEKQKTDLKTEIANLKQIQTIRQLQDLHNLQRKVQTMDTSINYLKSHEVARNQDFMSFFNTTNYQIYNLTKKSNIRDMELEGLNLTMIDIKEELNNTIIHNINDVFNACETRTEKLHQAIEKQEQHFETQKNDLRLQNKTIVSLQKENEKVALMGCAPSVIEYSVNEVIKFTEIQESHGINALSNFKSTGKFTCETPGLYFITAVIATNTNDQPFQIITNSGKVMQSYQVRTPGHYASFTGTAIVELRVNDTVWISPSSSKLKIYNDRTSCVTIFKF